jgi:hypothetical protein
MGKHTDQLLPGNGFGFIHHRIMHPLRNTSRASSIFVDKLSISLSEADLNVRRKIGMMNFGDHSFHAFHNFLRSAYSEQARPTIPANTKTAQK